MVFCVVEAVRSPVVPAASAASPLVEAVAVVGIVPAVATLVATVLGVKMAATWAPATLPGHAG